MQATRINTTGYSATSEMGNARACPRESMRVLPIWLQPFLTWLTGMPLNDEKPIFHWTPNLRATAAAAILTIGVLMGSSLVISGGAWLAAIPVAWLLTVSGMRDLYTVTEHYCTHHRFCQSRAVNLFIAEAISTILWAAPFKAFRHEHLKHHAVTRRDTDPDVIFLRSTGYIPGMSVFEFRKYILRTIFSPLFHARYFGARLVLNFTGPIYRVTASVVWLAALFSVLIWKHALSEWFVVWVVPLIFLFQAASLINFHAEHLWDDIAAVKGREAIALVCVGRFCGESAPQTKQCSQLRRLYLWSIWWTRILTLHIPHRLFILVGDQSHHDLHHRRPGSDWANAAFVRRDDILAGAPGWPIGYIDVWGTMFDHLDACVSPRESPKIIRHVPITAVEATLEQGVPFSIEETGTE